MLKPLMIAVISRAVWILPGRIRPDFGSRFPPLNGRTNKPRRAKLSCNELRQRPTDRAMEVMDSPAM